MGDPQTAGTKMEGILTAEQGNVQLVSVERRHGQVRDRIAGAEEAHRFGVVASQGVTLPALQSILTGQLTATVYERVSSEARATALLVKLLRDGGDPAPLTAGATVSTSAAAVIPAVLSTPVAVDRTNLSQTVVADGTVTRTQLCQELTPAQTGSFCA